jgi:hypothetical protein
VEEEGTDTEIKIKRMMTLGMGICDDAHLLESGVVWSGVEWSAACDDEQPQ